MVHVMNFRPENQWFEPWSLLLCYFLRQEILLHPASLYQGVLMGTGDTNAESNPVMDKHPVQRGVVILLVTLCWVSCDGPTSHPGGVVILLVTLCWVSCDGPTSHPGKSSNTPSHFMVGIL